MNLLKSVAVVCGLALGSLVLNTGEAQAAKNKYAMVAFKNNEDFTIKYYFRWGKDSEWKLYSVKPGDYHWHSWEYEFINENRSPTPQIKFDSDLSEDTDWVTYTLKAYAAPAQDVDYAKIYKFVTKSRGVLDLVSIGD